MMNRLYIFALLTAVLMLAAGCAHKKKITPTQTPVQDQEVIARENQRIQDSIALAQAQEQELRLKQEQELKRQQEEAEARKRAQVQTLYISRMTLTISMQGKQLSTPATMRWQRGEGALLSIQPFAGLEMARIELSKENVMIIDKINRRYTRLTYDNLSQMGARATIDEIDEWIDTNIIARKDEPQLTLKTSRANISATAVIYTSAMQMNANVNLRPTNVDSYRGVTLEQLVRGL